MDKVSRTHESYGIVNISKFSSNGSEFFGSDLVHNGGVSITISNGEVSRDLSTDRYNAVGRELVRIELTHNQFVDAITSGMNTIGVPCTIKRFNGKSLEQITHI